MENKSTGYFSRPLSLFFISLLELLEKLMYYGITPILILYAINEGGLQLEREVAKNYISWFYTLIALLPFLAGLLTDFFLKQKKAILLGAMIALVGGGLLMINELVFVVSGLILYAIGRSFLRINLVVLLGRLYDKSEQQRLVGFLYVLLMMNLGGFFGPAFTSLLRENGLGWNVIFGIFTISMILFILLFLLVQNRFELIETDIEGHADEMEMEAGILDSQMTGLKRDYNSLVLILTVIIISGIYWDYNDVIMNHVSNFLAVTEDVTLLTFPYPEYGFSILSAIFLFSFGLVFLFIWSIRKRGDSLWKIITAFGLLAAAAFSVSYLETIPKDNLETFLLISAFVIALADIFISPLVLTYVTRLSKIRYASTMVGLSYFLPYFVSMLLVELADEWGFNWIESAPVVLGSFFVILIVFKRQLSKMTGGIK